MVAYFSKMLISTQMNDLIIHSAKIINLGLFKGKIGLAILFFAYSKYEKSNIYSDFAGYLIDDVFEDICSEKNISLESGIMGISWGINYLLYEKYISGDSSYILDEINQEIMSYNPLHIRKDVHDTWFEDLLHYVLLNILVNKDATIPFDELYLKELHIAVLDIITFNKESNLKSLAYSFIKWREESVLNYTPEILLSKLIDSDHCIREKQDNYNDYMIWKIYSQLKS